MRLDTGLSHKIIKSGKNRFLPFPSAKNHNYNHMVMVVDVVMVMVIVMVVVIVMEWQELLLAIL